MMRDNQMRLFSTVALMVALLTMQPVRSDAQQKPAASADTGVVGAYDFWFTPSNNEQISGRIVLSRRLGRYTAIVTSPKLSDPEPADSVAVADRTVFLSFFGGQFTFTFHVSGDTISAGRFTKSIRGVSEEGQLDLKRAKQRG